MKKGKTVMTIQVKPTDTRNEMHFEVQKSTRANVFRNHKKYTRKNKHKKSFKEQDF